MAHVYVRSGASGSNDGSSKTNAYTSLGAALSAKAAGDNFWVASDHAQTQASALTLGSPGSPSAPCTIMCVDFAGSTPPVSADLRTTATITTTGAFGITIGGTAKYRGITISAGTGAVTSGITIGMVAGHTSKFESCVLRKLGTTGDTSAIRVESNNVDLENTQVDFGSTIDAITLAGGARFRWTRTSVPVVTVFPSTLFVLEQAAGMWLEGVDFSAAGFSGKSLLNVFSALNLADCHIVNCKRHSLLTVSNTQALYGGSVVQILTDSSGTNYTHDKKSYFGTQLIETTIVRTGGANDGVTPHSWRIDTTANAKQQFPFESLPLSIKNNTTGTNVTVTIFGTWGGGAVPTNRDIWPVISYMGSSGSPLATIVSGGAADYLAAATNWATDTSTWGGSTTKFKMAVTLSSPQPQLKGPIYVTICAAAASSTFYIDSKIVLT